MNVIRRSQLHSILESWNPRDVGEAILSTNLQNLKAQRHCSGVGSRTRDIRDIVVKLHDHCEYVFVDTPGFKDSVRPAIQVLHTIADWLGGNSAELQEAIESMSFGSVGDWTLQELLALPTLVFCMQDWSLVLNLETNNHKADPLMLEEVQKPTGIPVRHLKHFCPGSAGLDLERPSWTPAAPIDSGITDNTGGCWLMSVSIFSEFDSEAPNLDLVIGTPEVATEIA
ncbi:hypothetical protein BKA83DRAFT_4486732 [Pisolithus microcarpus]|nr:hypothetical protein BKA83DRAFT_4486732 [Pisolithus microcarpus]